MSLRYKQRFRLKDHFNCTRTSPLRFSLPFPPFADLASVNGGTNTPNLYQIPDVFNTETIRLGSRTRQDNTTYRRIIFEPSRLEPVGVQPRQEKSETKRFGNPGTEFVPDF
eukprot:380100-Rhodomonas_salina.1